ncbi:MAG: hypothetical protein SFV24_02895, partial [Gemmatimonadales bacterium]|nr:hypothetical protein [Gemmatimonadales bacterium]
LAAIDGVAPLVSRSRLVALLATDRHAVTSCSWPVIATGPALVAKEEFPNERLASVGYVGAKIYTPGILTNLLAACHGLVPWNGSYLEEDYLDGLLVPGASRPATAQVLTPVERAEYRRDRGLPV